MSGIKAVGFGGCAAPSSAARGSSQGDAKRRFRWAGRFAAAALCAAMLVLLGVSAAAARTAYVSNDNENFITPIDLATNTAGTPIKDTVVTSSIAITPDGKLAYAPSARYESVLTPFNLETGLAETPINISTATKYKVEPESLAITPDGKYVYVADEEANGHEGAVSVVEVATGKVVKVIEAGLEAEGVAFTPNGEFAWVADKANVKQGTVTVIEHASEPENAKVVKTIDIGTAEGCKDEGGKPAGACVEPEKIAITPDGQTAYVADGANGTVTKLNTKSYAVEATITVGAAGEDLREPNDIVISPDGQTGYVSDGEAGTVVPINLKTDEVGAPIAVSSPETEPRGLAFTPSGKTLYVAIEAFSDKKVVAVDTATNTIAAEINVAGEPDGVAIVPDQGPAAVFSATAAVAGSASVFNAGGSSAPEGGTITSYEWSFGDGATETTTTPEVSHVYAAAGEYEVKVTETDEEGCSEALVFTGQTAYCSADPAAEVHHTITVPSAAAEPVVSQVTPGEGPEAGLTMVTIHGEHLEGATGVSFGGSAAGIPSRDTATEIEVQTPAHAAGAVEVCATTTTGTGCKAAAFAYTATAPEPVVSEVTPDEGPEEGHTKVVIHGEHLEGATEVSFGFESAPTPIRDTATEIEVETPRESAGGATVCVTTASGTGCKRRAFRYVASPPVVTEVTPDEGSVGGHTMVTIHGEHLLETVGSDKVSFGGSPAGIPSTETETEIEVETPMHAAGEVEVCVTMESGTGCKAGAFTYTATTPPPVVSEVTPDEGPEEGHTKVVIHGEHLEGATEIVFGTKSAPTPIRDTATEIEVETPPKGASVVTVCVITAAGEGCKEEAFRYTTPPPVITEVTPDEGSVEGHTKVTIHGEHLLSPVGSDKVSFGGSPAVITSRETETEIEGVETPAHAAGAVEVCVTTASETCKAAAFTYKAPVVTGKNEAKINVSSEPVSEVQSLETTCSALNLGVWTPGSESDPEAHCELTATSTAASSTLIAEDTEAASKGTHAGYLENAGSYLTDPLQAQATDGHSHGTSTGFLSLGEHPVALLSFSEPISPDPVILTVKQHIGAQEGLRKGTYQETVTLTLANTEP